MIACLTLGEFANLATILGIIVAIVTLFFTFYQVNKNAKINRARFWLELEKMFQIHDPVHLKLRPGGEWADGSTGPTTNKEWGALEDYMGLFEHCEIMIALNLIDETTFSDIFKFRLRNIVSNHSIVDAKLCKEKEEWKHFLSLLNRFNVNLPQLSPHL
jgi:hypothetical protein